MLKLYEYQTFSFDHHIEALNYLGKNHNISNCSFVMNDYKIPQRSGIDLIKR
jgi:hypothetical protein